ncbi:MAG: cyanoexosortase A [Leptolyngbya sp. Prado105]|jgi:cyanoexosortase A|nr:cyanoexosortase A [Leptolyngbya sp. Prado105]
MLLSKLTQYSLLSLLSVLILLHLSLVFRSDNTDLIGSSLLYWFGAIFIFRRNCCKSKFESNPLAIAFGTLMLIPILTKSASITGNDIVLRLMPIFSIASLSLLASGSLKQYWRELLILSVFAIPPGLILLFFDPSAITAKVSGFSLWVLGFDVTVQGVFVNLPKGSIEVYSACAGVAAMLQLFGVALMYLFLQPTKPYQKILIPSVALTLAFIFNALRVALMAVLVALGDEKAFEYWHVGNGSLVFSMIAVIAFCFLCQFLLPTYETR